MNDLRKEIILALADNNMNVSATARAMYMHRNSITYNINEITEETGLNPLVFYDLVKLLKRIK